MSTIITPSSHLHALEPRTPLGGEPANLATSPISAAASGMSGAQMAQLQGQVSLSNDYWLLTCDCDKVCKNFHFLSPLALPPCIQHCIPFAFMLQVEGSSIEEAVAAAIAMGATKDQVDFRFKTFKI